MPHPTPPSPRHRPAPTPADLLARLEQACAHFLEDVGYATRRLAQATADIGPIDTSRAPAHAADLLADATDDLRLSLRQAHADHQTHSWTRDRDETAPY